MKTTYNPSSPMLSDSQSTFSAESQPYTVTDLNEVTRQTSLYEAKLRYERQMDFKDALKMSFEEEDVTVVSKVPTELLLPYSSVLLLRDYQKTIYENIRS